MNYRIKKKPEFKAFGIVKEFSHNGDKMQISNFFNECIKNGSFDALRKLSHEKYLYENMPKMSEIGCGKKGNDKMFSYMIGTLIFNDKQIPDEYTQITIPAHMWAIFESKHFQDGVDDDTKIIQDLWERIFKEWLPSSTYELADAPSIEQDFYDNPKECFVEIWIPIIKI